MKAFLLKSVLFLLGVISSNAQAADNSPLRIGWIGPLTGSAAALGVDSVPAIQMVFDEINAQGGINGRKLELVVEDDQYTTTKTLTAYNKLARQQNIRIIFVITYGGLFAVADKAEEDGVLLIDPLDCDEAIAALPSNTICVAKKTEDLGYVNAEAAAKRGDTPAGIIYFEGDPFMGTAAKASLAKFTELNQPAAYAEGYLGGTSDFKPMLLQAKKKGVKSMFFYGYDEMGLAMKQAREIGLKMPFYSMNTITSPGFKESAGQAAEGALAASWLAPRGPQYAGFIEQFEKRVGRKPFLEISTIPSYDIARLLADFLHEKDSITESGINSANVKRKFYAIKDYAGLSGIISIDSDGITRTFKNRMYAFNAGELVALESPK